MNNLTSKIKGFHFFAGVLFCLILCLGTISRAETPATVTAPSANIRASADTSSTVLASVKQNQTVSVIASTTGTDGNTWYQVWVDANTKGYIRGDLVSTTGQVTATTSATTTTTQTTNVDTSETQVTPVEAKAAYVTTDNVRIRKGASTNHGIAATAKRGMPVSVIGEATGADSKKWYQIQFTHSNETLTGFIRADFITFDVIANEAAVSEITGGEAGTEAPVEETATEETQEETVVEETYVPEPSKPVVELLNPETEPSYVMSGFIDVILTMNGEECKAYTNGSFYLLYANYDGVVGWYLFDSTEGIYSRYPYDVDATPAAVKAGKVGVLPVVLLVIISLMLAALSAFLYLKLREYEVDDEDEDDEEEAPAVQREVRRPVERKRHSLADSLDDEEDTPVRREPVRTQSRPAERRQQTPQRPVNRPQTNRPSQSQQQRPAGDHRVAQGQRPARPQASQRPSGNPSGQMRRPHNPVEQPMKKAVNQGSQARNFIETGDDGDIEFIDL